MKWYKVEDYPVGSDEYVLVSPKYSNKRCARDCFLAKKQGKYWLGKTEECYIDTTDRWCHIELPYA